MKSGTNKIMRKIKGSWSFVKQIFSEFVANSVLKFSASLAYYTILSLVPLLIIILSITGFFFGEEAIRGELYAQINDLVGRNAALEIQKAIQNIHLARGSFFATSLGVLVLVFGATGIFGEMQDSLNKIWGLRTKTRKIWWKLILDRLISFSIILCIGFVFIVSLLLNAVVSAISRQISDTLGGLRESFLFGLDHIIFIVISTALFATIFKVLPDARIKWKDVFVGAFITACLFTLGKYAIGLYLGQSQLGSIYGAAGSTMILMIWIYYSAAILYLGASFTKVYATQYGGKIYPSEYSVWIKHEEIPVNEVQLSDQHK